MALSCLSAEAALSSLSTWMVAVVGVCQKSVSLHPFMSDHSTVKDGVAGELLGLLMLTQVGSVLEVNMALLRLQM